MLSQPFSSSKREMHSRALSAEFVVIGGGFAGVCAAVTAARSGTKTILVQDRPVLEATLRAKFACGYSAPRHTWAITTAGRARAAWWMKYSSRTFIATRKGIR